MSLKNSLLLHFSLVVASIAGLTWLYGEGGRGALCLLLALFALRVHLFHAGIWPRQRETEYWSA